MIKPNKFVFETAKALIGLFSDTEEIKNIRKFFLDTQLDWSTICKYY